ncbi:hypothetical protein EJB05_00908, partial [Eragrostis curvula]
MIKNTAAQPLRPSKILEDIILLLDSRAHLTHASATCRSFCRVATITTSFTASCPSTLRPLSESSSTKMKLQDFMLSTPSSRPTNLPQQRAPSHKPTTLPSTSSLATPNLSTPRSSTAFVMAAISSPERASLKRPSWSLWSATPCTAVGDEETEED